MMSGPHNSNWASCDGGRSHHQQGRRHPGSSPWTWNSCTLPVNVVFDLKPLLWQEIALKEDDLRTFCKEHDWSQYAGMFVSVHCSADAIVPTWAFMLVATHLRPHAVAFIITQGDAEQLERAVFTHFVEQLDVVPYRDARVVVKGCSTLPVP